MGTFNFLNTVFQWGKGIDFWSPVHQFCVISINSLNAMFSCRCFASAFRYNTYPLLIAAYGVRNGMLLFCISVYKTISAIRWKHSLSRRIILAFLWKFNDQLNTVLLGSILVCEQKRSKGQHHCTTVSGTLQWGLTLITHFHLVPFSSLFGLGTLRVEHWQAQSYGLVLITGKLFVYFIASEFPQILQSAFQILLKNLFEF